jgi:sugar lactone lactonase YvrE
MTPDGERLYLADGPVLRSLDLATGEMLSLAGLASEPGYADGSAVEARLGFLNHDLSVDEGGGRVFLADRSNGVLRVFDTGDESLDTFAGPFEGPGGLSRDGQTMYLADTFGGALRAVDLESGDVELLVDGLADPQGVTWDGGNGLYALGFNGQLRRYDLATGSLTTVSTNPALRGSFASLVADRERGRLYFPRLGTSAIRVVELTTGEVWTLAGPDNPSGFLDGSVEEARFGWIYGLAATRDGQTIYVADTENAAVRVVDLAADEVTRILEDGWVTPVGLALDEDAGQLYVSDLAGGRISVVDTATSAVSWLTTEVASPSGLVLVAGELYATDANAGIVVRVDRTTGVSETIHEGLVEPSALTAHDDALFVTDLQAGTVTRVPLDGQVAEEIAGGLARPAGLAAHGGALYVAATGDHTLRAIDPTSGEVSVALGRPGIEATIGVEGVPAAEATLAAPEAVTATPQGLLVSVEYGAYLVPYEALP